MSTNNNNTSNGTPKPSSTSTSPSSSSPSSALPSSLQGTITPKDISKFDPSRVLNLNIGVLGHVDSGKTSLVKTLSTLLSTASLDKSSQSRQRGITLDLGFSAFLMPLPPSIQSSEELVERYDLLQVTLVDCPGHASLIRTIIGGAQIIDMVVLVVDANKGIQTQTAECLVIAEMTTQNLIVVLNKIDMIPEEEREEKLQKVKEKIRAVLRNTRFKKAPMCPISACVGGEKVAATNVDDTGNTSTTNSGGGGTMDGSAKNHQHHQQQHHPETMNLQGLLDLLNSKIKPPNRSQILNSKFHFAIDHCFPIKGQGTVMTGTCLAGSIQVNDIIEFPTLSVQRKVKSMQMFRRKVMGIKQGDRAGICVSNLDPKMMERGVAASPDSVKLIAGAIAVVKKITYFKGSLGSGTKFHISVGHTTVMATVSFWGAREIAKHLHILKTTSSTCDDNDGEKVLSVATTSASTSINESNGKKKSKGDDKEELKSSSLGGNADTAGLPHLKFDIDESFIQQDDYLESIEEEGETIDLPLHYALIDFQTPVYCPVDSLIIGSRLDTDIQSNCRLAFAGRLLQKFDVKKDTNRLKLYTRKEKYGVISRLGDAFKREDDGKIVRYEVFGSDLFKKETNMTQFIGLHLETAKGEIGVIQSSFGTSGKFKVFFPAGVESRNGDKLFLRFKRYAHDPEKKIRQDSQLPAERCGARIESENEKKKKKKSNSKAVIGKIASMKGDLLENDFYPMVIVEGFFTPEINVREKVGMKVKVIETGQVGSITGSFGKAGKCKVGFPEGLSEDNLGKKVELLEG